MIIRAVTQAADGRWRRLRGNVELETTEMILSADEVDYNEETQAAEARGHVHFRHKIRLEEVWADKAEYNLDTEAGRFDNIRGTSQAKMQPRPRLLATQNPFYFEGRWAEKSKDKYILHDGMLTNCKMPKPWWTLRGPKFDIIPGERALVYRTVFRIKRIPLFYSPLFYKSLEAMPRRSGFLTPNIGNSSLRGKMVGAGYYWAINRSFDAAYRSQYFTQRGFAHHVDFRGTPAAGTEFGAILYGVNDRGQELPNGQRRKQGGFIFSFEGKSDLGHGWHARGEVNYLSSLQFRQAFTESYNEAVFSEVHSAGFVEKHWSSYGLNFVMSQSENFQRVVPEQKISIRKLPQVEFITRDHLISNRVLPIWVSLESSAGLVRRDQSLYQTRQFLERMDFYPHVMTALRWKGFSLLPGFAVRGTHWGERFDSSTLAGRHIRIIGENFNRTASEVSLDLIPPSLEKTFNGPRWLGETLKHVIEPRAAFRYSAGVKNFDQIIRFDETEIYSDTNEAEVSVINRLYAKRGGEVHEVMSWQLTQRRFFDPDFGGAVVAGRRNVVLSAVELTPFAFLDRPRSYSPVVSVLRLSPSPHFGLQWRTDYDPLRSKIVNGGLSADARFSNYFVSIGQNHVRSVPLLTPPANQIRGVVGFGNENRPGWSGAFSAVYDYRKAVMQFATTQVTYNTDCCGFSVQYRRFSFGTRNENQFRVAFSMANIGSFGTLKKQERLF